LVIIYSYTNDAWTYECRFLTYRESVPSHAFLCIRRLFNDTNKMHTFNLLRVYFTFRGHLKGIVSYTGERVQWWPHRRVGIRLMICSLNLSDLILIWPFTFLLIALWLWGQLSLWEKWVPGEFPGGKCGRCVRLMTLPPSCAIVMKSGNLNFLEPPGPLQACNGTTLPFMTSYFKMENWCYVNRASPWDLRVTLDISEWDNVVP